jgi:hypothetical protein
MRLRLSNRTQPGWLLEQQYFLPNAMCCQRFDIRRKTEVVSSDPGSPWWKYHRGMRFCGIAHCVADFLAVSYTGSSTFSPTMNSCRWALQ